MCDNSRPALWFMAYRRACIWGVDGTDVMNRLAIEEQEALPEEKEAISRLLMTVVRVKGKNERIAEATWTSDPDPFSDSHLRLSLAIASHSKITCESVDCICMRRPETEIYASSHIPFNTAGTIRYTLQILALTMIIYDSEERYW